MNHVERAKKMWRGMLRTEPRDGVPETVPGGERDARLLAGCIAGFWHAHGYTQVAAWIVRERQVAKQNEPRAFYVVASNLVNGMPPGADPRAVARIYGRRK